MAGHPVDIQALLDTAMRRHEAMLEEACEVALLTGNCGVMVTWHQDALLASIVVTPRVPYGEIWERRSY